MSIAAAVAQMCADGMLEPPPGHPKVDGKIHRYGPTEHGPRPCWYRLTEMRTRGGQYVVVGAYGDWRRGQDSFRSIEVDWEAIPKEDRADAQRRRREAEEAERRKREELAEKAAARARARWRGAYTIEQARDSGVALPYCERKGVEPETCRVMLDGTLLIPMMLYDDSNGSRMVGVQYISPAGEKKYTRNATRLGACTRLGAPPADGDTLVVCEGWATGLSIRMATERALAVFVAFDTSGLRPAAQILRARYPSSPIVVCADDDWKTEVPKGTPYNAGVVAATRAAEAVGNAWVIRPLFREAGRQDKWTDYNDVHAAYGLEEVARQLDIARLIASEPPIGGALAPACSARPAAEKTPPGGDVPPSELPPGGDGDPPPPDGPPPGPPDGSDTPPQPGGGPEVPTWHFGLQRTKEGRLKPTVNNAFLLLRHSDEWQGVLGYDTFAEQVRKLRPPPFEDGATVGEWTEMDDHRLLLWLSRRIGEMGTEAIGKAVQLVAHLHEFNPLQERLEGLAHDGVMRVRTWLRDYLGVCTGPDFERLPRDEQDRQLTYMELVGTKWLVAAVARVFEPGVRVDNMLILEGCQGAMKSTALRVLGGEWFTDATLRFEDKDSLLILQGRWIIEMAELEGMNKADASATKKFLTQHIDLFRPPYGRKLIQYPRRCIFAGTVNHDAYLKDDSGNRRFWPVSVARVDVVRLREDVDQLWAEAVALYKRGEVYWVRPEERALFEESQDARFDADAWDETVLDYLNGTGDHAMAGRVLQRVQTPQIMADVLKLDKARWDLQAKRRIVSILKRHGWIRRKDSAKPRAWWYVRPSDDAGKDGPTPAGHVGVDDDAF